MLMGFIELFPTLNLFLDLEHAPLPSAMNHCVWRLPHLRWFLLINCVNSKHIRSKLNNFVPRLGSKITRRTVFIAIYYEAIRSSSP